MNLRTTKLPSCGDVKKGSFSGEIFFFLIYFLAFHVSCAIFLRQHFSRQVDAEKSSFWLPLFQSKWGENIWRLDIPACISYINLTFILKNKSSFKGHWLLKKERHFVVVMENKIRSFHTKTKLFSEQKKINAIENGKKIQFAWTKPTDIFHFPRAKRQANTFVNNFEPYFCWFLVQFLQFYF